MLKMIDIPKHSVVMLIGPSNSGKSYFATEHLKPSLVQAGAKVKYLSSDNYRRDMLDNDSIHKHSNKMMGVSKQAFSKLYSDLDLYTQYPVNMDVVIVDATHLSKQSRASVTEIAERNAYGVVAIMFDYAEIKDYVMYADDLVNRKVVFDMVKTMRTQTLKELDKSEFSKFYKFTSIGQLNECVITMSEVRRGVEVKHDNVCFVGDLHGCYEEFIELLNDNKGIRVDGETMELHVFPGAVENNAYVHHILVGDIVDKGPDEGVEKLIRFLAKNRQYFAIVEGNHDRWVYNYLKGKIKPNEDNDKLIDNYFTSVKYLQHPENEELKNIFLNLYESMSTFAYSDRFIVTHAPCESKYLGKDDKVSLKRMNTCMYPKKKDYGSDEEYLDAREKYFSYLISDAQVNQPLHVFGHVALTSVFQHKNKYGIDTGCVSGNCLTGLVLMKGNKKPFIKKYKSRQPVKDQLVAMFRINASDVSFSALERDVQTRLKWCVKNQVNFISGTMSPCDKFQGELESLRAGINYYLNRGVSRIMLQPKFMGSRCNVLLHVSDVTKCRAISRNAYEIKQERLSTDDKLEDVFKGIQGRLGKWMIANNLEYVLLDGELLPWTVMGKDLIERDFMLAYKACSSELDILSSTGFEKQLSAFDAKFNSTGGDSKPHELAMFKTYESFKDDILHTDMMRESLNKYKKQLDIFAAPGPLEFSPFSILKTVKADGTEENWVSSTKTNMEIYDTILKKDTWMMLDWDASYVGEGNFVATMAFGPDRNTDLRTFYTLEEALTEFWAYITSYKEMEGVVIKPDQVYIPGVAPYLKCRNKEYLRLTYGFDYDALPVKKQRLYENKSIKRKLETSIKEWELAKNLLDVPLNDISIENKKWLSFAVRLLSEQDHEKELDPRL